MSKNKTMTHPQVLQAQKFKMMKKFKIHKINIKLNYNKKMNFHK